MTQQSCSIMLRVVLAIVAWVAIAGGAFAGSGMRVHSNVPLADMPSALVDAQADHLLNEGFLDVTRAPYNAANDGSVDVTAVLQQAIDDAYFSNLAVYFPKGTYLVSGQLHMQQRKVPGLSLIHI